ncbi:BTAD domain-containing putative transcriptional regulator [Goodfellowiella coeruleoviolacea]|uniref:ATPase n=1 Tax=Goodfellowiella coeruleoviolacea TaxID=334858 RepID=A0AAE3KJT3_9PSEU|nr:BTAD domain-containing putative transcriptional regulator [Goodfellowiella coeruleoviolacea]MCP2169432.1 putative ATPase [Goodfellowiella coeruleoviolacea]
MRFGVLGPLAVWTAEGQPVRVPDLKVRALLADLLVHEGRPVSAERLIEDVWGDRLPRNPTNTLHTRVSQLRRALAGAEPGGRDLVVSQPAGYLLRVPAEAVDAGRFRALVARAGTTRDPRARADLLADALALWRGPAYADFADAEFVRPSAARLAEERLAALEQHVEARLELGEHAALAGELADLVARHPLRERLRAAHLLALYRAGRQGEALSGYAEVRAHLADALGVDPGPRLRALHAAMLRQDPALDAPAGAGRPRGNLPAAVTDLVGRADAVEQVRGLVGSARLVTLTGPGGVGKTQLALDVARAVAGGFPDGAWLVELAGLDRASGAATSAVADVVAAVLDIRDDVGPTPGCDPLSRLAGALRAKHLLLVLDNCEHVIEPVAALVEALLRAAPGLRVLATGQAPLAIPGERVWLVPPLALPDPAAGPEDVSRASAVALFVARAAAAAPGFALDRDNAAAVAAICRRLDGIPLALELAATRVRGLGVRELAARLDDRFRVLTSGWRGAPARQRTLRAMIDYSWELLSQPERVVLRRLAVHADGCPLAAAEQVGAQPGVDVLDLLVRLVDRSLVLVVDGPDGPRYRLLESVRDYCLERLREAGEHDEVHRRHLHCYLEFAERAQPHLHGHEQRRWLRRLDDEWANLRTALETAVRLADGGAATRLVSALGWYWVLRGRLAEARRCLDLALGLGADALAASWRAAVALLLSNGAEPDGASAADHCDRITDPRARARARWLVSYAQRGFAGLATTASLLDQALAAFRELDDRWGVAAALSVRATISRARGELASAERDALDSAGLFHQLGDQWGQVKATNTLAEIAEIRGDYPRASALHREGLRMAEDLGLWSDASLRLSGLGRIALLEGDFAAADQFHRRALDLAVSQFNRVAEHFAEAGLALSARRQGRYAAARDHLEKWVDWLRGVEGEPGLALALTELGFAAEQLGEAETALRLHRESLRAARAVGDPRAVALSFEGLAGAHRLAGQAATAARLLGAAAALRQAVGAPLPPAERADVDRLTRALRDDLGPDAFDAEFQHGTRMPPESVPA